MIARTALLFSLAMLLAGPALADGKHDRRHHGWHGHHHGYSHGWPRHRHRWHDHRHRGARIVIWQPVPVHRTYPAPVYVPVPVVQEPVFRALPMRDFQDTSGRYCREYQRLAVIDGREQPVYGTACLMPDGAWRIVSE